MLCCPTIKEASELTGIPQPTIYANLRKEDFKRAYYEAKSDMLRQTTTFLQAKTSEAVKIIETIAKDASVNPQTRVSACRTLLEYSLKFTETGELLERLSALEDNFHNDI